jgi:Protein kinase domain
MSDQPPLPDEESTHAYQPPPALAPGERFPPGTVLTDRYRIVSALGRGGMGEVYRADDLSLGQPVALKFLPAHLANDPDRLARFRKEVAIARQVSHPHCCRVYDIADHRGQTFLTMEYIDGEDLTSLLSRVGRLPEEKATQLARELCLALAAVHEQGLLHRDLKPANVMLDGRGKVRLADFGLAAAAQEIGAAQAREGTPAYQAPEQLKGESVDARSDLFALGLVLYELFTGKRAFALGSREELLKRYDSEPPSKPSGIVVGLGETVEHIILRCLAKDPKDRPSSAYAVLAALPGGDPLQDALAKGETPSPRMVENAKVSGILSPVRGLVLLTAIAMGLVLFLLLYNRVMLVGRVGLPEPTDALAGRARDVLKLARHDERFDSAVGYDHDKKFLRWVQEHDPSSSRWDRVNRRPAAAIYFWYRQSPVYLVPHLYYPYAGSIEVSRITWGDPSQTVPGMASVKLDVHRRLLEFVRVPSKEDSGENRPPNWREWFLFADLELSRFDPEVKPSHVPPVFADHQYAWVRSVTEEADEKIRVEAATYRGQVVYFVVAAPWTASDSEEGEQGAGLSGSAVSQFHLFVLVLVAMFVLAPYSLHTGSADSRGAFRLGTWVFGIQMLVWLFETHHVFDRSELRLFVMGLAFALYWAALIAFSYLTLEPFVRRWWPETVISWARLLSGRLRDSLVGRDILIGVLGGVGFTVIGQLGNQVPGWLGEPAPTPWWDWWVPNTQVRGYWMGNFLINLVYSFRTAFFFNLLFLLLLRVLLRIPWLAGICYVLIWTAINAVDGEVLSPSWTWLFFALNNLLLLGLLIRFGVLTIITASFVINTLWFPITTDLSAWYARDGLWAIGIVLALAVYGCWVSLDRRAMAEA